MAFQNELDITAVIAGDEGTLSVSGELDLFTANRLRKAIVDAVDTGIRILHVDLSGLTSIDIAGMDALVRASARSEAQGCLVLLRNTPERMLELLHYVDRQEALRLEG
jgi:anti-sigma B factor antagonist